MTPAEIKHLKSLLSIHRRNYVHYKMQARAHGGIEFAPAITRNSIENTEREIERIERQLIAAGVEVE